MRELLVDFYRQNTGRKPEAIIFYRTDVGADVHDEVGLLLVGCGRWYTSDRLALLLKCVVCLLACCCWHPTCQP